MSFAIHVCIKATILLMCAGLLSSALARASASVRYAIWAAALLGALALPVISTILPEINFEVLPESRLATAGPPAVPLPIEINAISVTSPAIESPARADSVPWDWTQWLLLLWAAGACIVMLPSAAALWDLHRLKAVSNQPLDDSWKQSLAELQKKFSISQPVDLRIAANPAPLAAGIFRKTILLPQTAAGWSTDRRRFVLAHEMAHVKRNDALGQFLSQIVCGVYWFNPLVWYAVHRLRIERERACDDYVLSLGASAADYADHLVQIARGLNDGLRLFAVSMAHPSQLKSRIVAILDSRMRRKQMTRFTSAAFLTATAVLTAGLGSIQFTRLAAIPLPSVAPPIAAPVPAAMAPLPPIAKPAQVPPQEPGYVLNRAPIFYPAVARQKRVEGSVVVELNFSANGEIVESRVLSGPEELRQSALQTALQGKYAVHTKRSLQVIVDFRLPFAGTGEISGAVFTADASSVPIPGVIIAATNTASGITTTMVSDQNGAYMFRNLSQGTYRLSARLTSFQDKSFDSIQVGDTQQLQFNFGLRSDADAKRVWSIAASSPISLPDQFNIGPIANIRLFGLSESGFSEMTENLGAFKGQLISTDLLTRMRTSIKETRGDQHADFTIFSRTDGAIDVLVGFTPQGPPVVDFGPGDVRVAGNVVAANLVRQVKPVYPQAAKDNRIQGVVVLEVKIATDGTVSNPRVVTGPAMFVEPSLDAVRQWVYKPVLQDGRPVEAVSTIPINFAFGP
jgi:TonB family protein